MNNKLVKKFHEQQKKSKILELITEGKTYNEIATQVGVTRTFVTDTLAEELASATTPEKILELRSHQNETLQSHTTQLHKRFNTQTNLSDRLAKSFEQKLDEENNYTFTTRYNQYLQDGHDPEQATKLAKNDIEQYRSQREQIIRDMERTSKLADQHYQTLLKHEERLAKLNGLDLPTQHNILVHRRDEQRTKLEQAILETQAQLEAPEAQIVED